MTHVECNIAFNGLKKKYGKRGVYWIKNGKNWATHVQVMPSWMFMFLSWPLTFINRSQVYLISVSGQPSEFIDFLNQIMLQWLGIEWLNRLRNNQRPISFMWPSRPLAPHLSLTYLTFICFIIHWLILLTQLKLFKLLKLYTMFNYLIYIKVIMTWVSIIY